MPQKEEKVMYEIIHGEIKHRHKISQKFRTKTNAKKYVKQILQRKGTRGAFVNPRIREVRC